MDQPYIDWILPEEGSRRRRLQLQLLQGRIDELLAQPVHRIRIVGFGYPHMCNYELCIVEPNADRSTRVSIVTEIVLHSIVFGCGVPPIVHRVSEIFDRCIRNPGFYQLSCALDVTDIPSLIDPVQIRMVVGVVADPVTRFRPMIKHLPHCLVAACGSGGRKSINMLQAMAGKRGRHRGHDRRRTVAP